jgi:uncharacterized protein (UPF0254 family)
LNDQNFFAVARSHIRKRLSATLHIGTTDGTYRGKVLGAADLAEGMLWRAATDVLASINQIEQRLTTQRQIAEQPYTLIFTLDTQGQIVEYYSPVEG